MGFKKSLTYYARCDKCPRVTFSWVYMRALRNEMKHENWYTKGKKVLCPNCKKQETKNENNK